MIASQSQVKSGLLILITGAGLLLSGCRVAVGYYDGSFRHRHSHRHNYRPGPHDCRFGRCYNNLTIHTNSSDKNELTESAILLSQDFAIRHDSAQKIIEALNMNSEEQRELLKQNGIRLQDLAPLQELKLPSEDTIQKMANYLHEDKEKVEQIMLQYAQDMAVQD